MNELIDLCAYIHRNPELNISQTEAIEYKRKDPDATNFDVAYGILMKRFLVHLSNEEFGLYGEDLCRIARAYQVEGDNGCELRSLMAAHYAAKNLPSGVMERISSLMTGLDCHSAFDEYLCAAELCSTKPNEWEAAEKFGQLCSEIEVK